MPSSVVGTLTRRTPRIQLAATYPPRSVTAPPPSATTVPPRSMPMAASASQHCPATVSVLPASASGTGTQVGVDPVVQQPLPGGRRAGRRASAGARSRPSGDPATAATTSSARLAPDHHVVRPIGGDPDAHRLRSHCHAPSHSRSVGMSMARAAFSSTIGPPPSPSWPRAWRPPRPARRPPCGASRSASGAGLTVSWSALPDLRARQVPAISPSTTSAPGLPTGRHTSLASARSGARNARWPSR